jgi:hypothetical protein
MACMASVFKPMLLFPHISKRTQVLSSLMQCQTRTRTALDKAI